jgi:serine/threonine protein kinase
MSGANDYTGKLIGGYRVGAEVNNNGLSCVYRGAQNAPPERIVALKFWYTLQLAPLKQLQFLQEVRVLKMLKHPQLLPILDGGIYEDRPYLVTGYALGGSLRERLGDQPAGPVPLQETLTILSQVGQALQYVHQFHITHGNLKPENILFTAHGDALLSDFAISTLLDAASGALMLTVRAASYMAPEQFQGATSEASDQYALGCIGYELLTGRLPFTAVDFSAMGLKHASESPLPPTLLNMLLPVRIEEAILKALAKQQGDRHASVKDLLAALGPVSKFQPRMLPVPVPPRPALPAIFSSWPLARPASIVNTVQEIKQQQAGSGDSPRETRRQADLPVTHSSITKTGLPLTSSEIDRYRKGGEGSRLSRLAIITLSIVIIASVISIFSFAFLPLHSPRVAVLVTPQSPAGIPSSGPSPASTPIPTVVPSKTPFPTPTPTLQPSPAPPPKPSPTPSPLPTPSPSPVPALTVTPGQFNASTDCSFRRRWYTCNAILTLPQNAQGEVSWTASSNGLNQAIFSPPAGTLSPGQQQQVVISVRTNCPATGSLIFSAGGNTITVGWSC